MGVEEYWIDVQVLRYPSEETALRHRRCEIILCSVLYWQDIIVLGRSVGSGRRPEGQLALHKAGS